MAIRLKLKNRTPDLTEYRIYRFEGIFDVISPPPPLVVLPGTAEEFLDTNVERNVLYQYCVGAVKGGQETFSKVHHLGYIPYTGPGPQELKYGDHKYGYYGRVSPILLPSATDLATEFTLSWPRAAAAPLYWLKFIIDGKILFIPTASLFNTASFDDVYAAGLAFGIQGTGLDLMPANRRPATAVNQWRTILKDNDEFLVRLPRAEGLKTYPDVTSFSANLAAHEWSKLWDAAFVLRDARYLYPNPNPKIEVLPITEFAKNTGSVSLIAAAVGNTSIGTRGSTATTEVAATRLTEIRSNSACIFFVLELQF